MVWWFLAIFGRKVTNKREKNQIFLSFSEAQPNLSNVNNFTCNIHTLVGKKLKKQSK